MRVICFTCPFGLLLFAHVIERTGHLRQDLHNLIARNSYKAPLCRMFKIFHLMLLLHSDHK